MPQGKTKVKTKLPIGAKQKGIAKKRSAHFQKRSNLYTIDNCVFLFQYLYLNNVHEPIIVISKYVLSFQATVHYFFDLVTDRPALPKKGVDNMREAVTRTINEANENTAKDKAVYDGKTFRVLPNPEDEQSSSKQGN